MASESMSVSSSTVPLFHVTDSGVSFPWLNCCDPARLPVWNACVALFVIHRAALDSVGVVPFADSQVLVGLLHRILQLPAVQTNATINEAINADIAHCADGASREGFLAWTTSDLFLQLLQSGNVEAASSQGEEQVGPAATAAIAAGKFVRRFCRATRTVERKSINTDNLQCLSSTPLADVCTLIVRCMSGFEPVSDGTLRSVGGPTTDTCMFLKGGDIHAISVIVTSTNTRSGEKTESTYRLSCSSLKSMFWRPHRDN